MNGCQRFLAACNGKPVDRTPVWMMRQAGRYLPEYRAVRERVDFLTLCKTPELAAEVSLQPVRRFGVDACIVFSDILIPVEAMGVPIAFTDHGPALERPVRSAAQVNALRVPEVAHELPFVFETLRLLRAQLEGQTALVGFCGGPFTLASYLVEGEGTKRFGVIKQMLYGEPDLLESLLDKLAQTVARHALAQVQAGAQAVQVFDTWAGELTPGAYERFALPYQRTVISAIRHAGVPAILYVNGCAGVLELMAGSGAEVLSLDWRIDLDAARQRVGRAISLQGNVDPAALLATPQIAAACAKEAMKRAGPTAHILNLGHGMLPQSSLRCTEAFVGAPRTAVVAG